MNSEKHTPGSILTEEQIKRLPNWCSTEKLGQAFRAPSDNLIQAALAVGRILRSGDGGGEAVTACRDWVGGLKGDDLSLLGTAAEGMLEEAAKLAQNGPQNNNKAEAPSTWVSALVTCRDDAESLLFVLGLRALAGNETAAQWESKIRERARAVDRSCDPIEDAIADALAASEMFDESSWITRGAALANGQWWLDLLFVRANPTLRKALEANPQKATGRAGEAVKELLRRIKDALAGLTEVLVPLPAPPAFESFSDREQAPAEVVLVGRIGDLEIVRRGRTLTLWVPDGHRIEGVAAELEIDTRLEFSGDDDECIDLTLPDHAEGHALRLTVRIDGDELALPPLRVKGES